MLKSGNTADSDDVCVYLCVCTCILYTIVKALHNTVQVLLPLPACLTGSNTFKYEQYTPHHEDIKNINTTLHNVKHMQEVQRGKIT